MAETDAYLTVTLDLEGPIELGDFVRLFSALGEQFDAHIQRSHPNLKGVSRFYIREIRKGSIVADIIPIIRDMLDFMETVVVVTGFASVIATIVKTYVKGERAPDATRKDLDNVIDLCQGVARDRGRQAKVETVIYEQGIFKRRLEVSFDTKEARRAIEEAKAHKMDMEEDRVGAADYVRVLMVFERSSTRNAALGTRSGEMVVIEEIDLEARPLIYASDMAEQSIKHEIRHANDNVFKKGFVVDVIMETKDGRPIAYRVTEVHQIIDLPDDDEATIR